MDLGLKDRVALVTGGSGGIGATVARTLAAEGARVAIGYHSSEDAAKRVCGEIESLGGTAMAVRHDLEDPATIQAAVDAIDRTWGGPDVLVTSAWVHPDWPGMQGPAVDPSPARVWAQQLEANLEGTAHSVNAVVPKMKERSWGRIVFISSAAAEDGQPGLEAYAAAKSGQTDVQKLRQLLQQLGDREKPLSMPAPPQPRSRCLPYRGKPASRWAMAASSSAMESAVGSSAALAAAAISAPISAPVNVRTSRSSARRPTRAASRSEVRWTVSTIEATAAARSSGTEKMSWARSRTASSSSAASSPSTARTAPRMAWIGLSSAGCASNAANSASSSSSCRTTSSLVGK